MGALNENNKVKNKEKLFEKLGITDKSLKEDVKQLKCWIEKQPKLPNLSHLNLDVWLENQLIMSKNSLEKAKTNIDKYFCARAMCPELFVRRDVLEESLCQSYETLTISYLPGLTDRLHRVCIVRIEECEGDMFPFEAHLKRCLMAVEYYLKEGIDFTGFHIVFDLKHFKLNHLTAFKISLLKTMSIAMKAFPVSFAVINLLNYPPFIEKALAVFKPFISTKLFSRIILLKDVESLKEYIGDVQLPSDYSGESNISQKEFSDLMKKNFYNMRDYILKCDQMNCEEYKHFLKERSSSDAELIGSFRMLTVD